MNGDVSKIKGNLAKKVEKDYVDSGLESKVDSDSIKAKFVTVYDLNADIIRLKYVGQNR